MKKKGRTNPPINEIEAVVVSIVNDFSTEVQTIGEEIDRILTARLAAVNVANKEPDAEGQPSISKARLICVDLIVEKLAWQLRHGIVKADFQAKIGEIISTIRTGGNLDDLYRMRP